MEEDETAPSDGWELLQKDTTKSSTFESNDASNSNTSPMNKCAVQSSFKSESVNNSDMEVDQHKQTNMKRRLGVPVGAPAPKIKRTRQNIAESKIPKLASNLKNSIESGLLNVKENSPNTDSNTPVQEEAPQSSPLIIPIVDENNVMTVSSNESENAQEYLEKKNVLASSSLSDICNESSLPVCKNTVLDNENIEKRLLPTNNEQFEFSSKIPLQQSPVPENVISPYKYELTDCTTLSSQLSNNASQETPFNSTENIVNSTNLLPVTNHSLLDTITTEPISEATDKLTEEMCKDNYSMNTISSLREKSDLLNTQSEISDALSNSESKPQSDGLIPQNVLVSIADGAEDTSCDQIKTVSNSPKSPLLQLIETTGNQSENLDTDDQMNDEEASKKVVTRLIPIVLEDDWQLQDKQDKLKEEETTPANITSTNEENGDEPEADKPVDKDSSIMASLDDNENATSLIDDKVKIKMEPNSDEDSDCDSSTKALRRRAGTATELSAKPKVKNLRRNIRDILGEDKLEENTLAAQKEEQLRLQRLQEKRTAMREYMEQQQEERLIAEVAEAAEAVTAAEAIQDAELNIEQEVKEEELPAVKIEDTDVVVLSSEEEKESESSADEDEDEKKKSDIDSDAKSKPSDESDSDSDSDIMVLSQSDEEEESEDANNSGAHINDDFNAPDAQGRVLVNVGHPENEEDIFLAQQLATAVKPHQIGGIRFLYDNIIESIEQYKTSNGFGCILAHSMGLGKTLQVVSFTDIFLRHTEAKNVLIIVPINTIQNWQAEYNQWIPEERPPDTPDETEIRTRNFKVFILNDGQKNIKARARVITAWHEEGGVLLMGYELYRQLSLKKPKKPKKKKKKRNDINSELVDIEEEDKDKELLDEMHKYLVRPGPDLVICDEGHRIKNAHANISQALKNIRTKRRVVLTGYPLQNNLIEYWCMVDFIRPNYLGTKTEFCNMFERPIQNGQCVDSTPQDMTIMRYRAHVLHSLLEGFVQRRGHSVLAKTLPLKQEQVLLCRMTPVQRSLYKAYMAELNSSKAVANPLKAFAICCKIWNHPDVLYNFVMKRMNEDYDLDLDEVVGKPGKTKKGAPGSKGANNSLPFQQPPMPNWNIQQPLMANQQQQSPMKFRPPMSEMGGVSNNMGQTMSPSPMMHMDSNSQMNYNMSNQNMYNMNQNYNMNHMQFTPWGFNQGYSNESNPQQQQHHFSNAYGNFSNQYQQMQQQQQQQHATMGQTMGHMQQQQLPLAGFHSMGMGPPPAHPSMHPQSPSMTQTNSVAQQGALNLSHQTPNATGMNQEMSGSMMGQNMPPTNQHMPPSNQPLSLPNSNQSMTSNLLNQQSLPQNNQNGPPLSSPDSEFSKMVSEGHQLQTNIPYQSQQLPEHLPTYLNDSMKNLDIDNSMHADSKDGLSLTPKQEVPMGGKMNDVKGHFTESEDKKDEIKEKKEEFKKEKEEVSYEWAESILKDYELGKVENSTKFQIFFKILEGTIKVKDRLLVFSQSLFTLSQLEEYLQRALIPGTFDHWAKNRSYFRLDGSTSAQEREKLINEFNSNIGIHLFLVSTRAGSLGINLVGANRVIVFDASFNPCHDTQAVCRVYRYGQQKPCHIYRLVTDNSLERRIYDRQVNKQGISDRIVDEMNPDAHLSSKEISNLLVEDEADEDDSSEEQEDDAADINDDILKQIIKEKRIMFTRLPFQHESLLVDRKDKRLSNAEKRLAKRSYERAKQANISYNRPSYSSFYPNNSMMSTKIGGVVYAKPVGTVRPMQSDNKVDGGGTMMHRPNILSRSSHPVENLAKQGVSVQQITVPKDVSIPTNSGDGKPIQLKSGQSVMVIKTQKGMYLRLSDGKIVAIRVPPEEAFGMPLNQGSVTIVPTMNSPRARGRGTRRGRPPLSAQYALGQIVPKGTPKGQVAVRILRKPVGVGRGRKSYQTIAVPVSSSATLLNKSVVITPAKPAPSKYSKDPSKVSPQVQITPVTQGTPRGGLNSIAGTSGINQRLNRNKILSAAKSEEIRKQQLIRNRLAHLSRKDAVLQPTDKDPESKSDDDEASMSSQEEMKDDASQSGASQLSKDSPKPEEQNVLPSSTPNSPSTPTSLIPQAAVPEEDSSKPIKNIFQSLDTSRSLSGSSSTSEPILGIVKPLVHDNENHVSPLQGLSNLIPPGENGPGPPPSSLAPLSMPPCSSQPLFQPFLQQSSTSSAPTTTYSDAGLTWSKNLDSVSMASNVAHVAPQVQQIAKSEAPAPSFLPSYSSSFTTQGQSLTTPPFSSDSLLHNTDQSPLSLSNLLGTPSNQQQFSHQQEEGQQQSSSALDFLNYPLASASSSAFRRPDYPTGDIFNPVSTHSPSSIASSPPVSSPASFNTTSYPTAPQYNYRMPHAAVPGGFRPTPLPAGYPPYSGQYGTYPGQYPNTTMGQYAGLQTPGNPYQGYPPPNPPGSGSLPPYSSSLSGFGHGSYPPM